MPPLTTTCPKCQKVFQIKPEMQGKQCRCANCQYKFVIKANSVENQSTVSPVDEEVVAVEYTSAPQPTANPSKANNKVIEPEVVQAEAVDQAEKKISSFEELADKLVSARSEASNKSSYDPNRFLAYSTNANMVSRDSSIERSTRLVIHGGAMMLFAMMLLPFVFIGIHVTGWAWTCPLGGLLAAFIGCLGALLTTVAFFRRNATSAVLYGVAPGAIFLIAGGLIVFLMMNEYWGSPMDSIKSRIRNSVTSQSPAENRASSPRSRRPSSSSNPFRNR